MGDYWYLSQSQLNLLDKCPPQFQRVYLQEMSSILSFEQQEKMAWGKTFHLLMQQYNLGVNIDNLSHHNPPLVKSVKDLIEELNWLWYDRTILSREAEYCLTLTEKNSIFTVIYDLLVLYPDRGIIFDWKTYPLPQEKNKIINHWQTKLYLYALTEKFDYLPENISLIYWFVQSPNKPEKLEINYNQTLHNQISDELDFLLEKLNRYYQDYQDFSTDFPHHGQCQNCPYRDYFSRELSLEHDFTPQSWEEL